MSKINFSVKELKLFRQGGPNLAAAVVGMHLDGGPAFIELVEFKVVRGDKGILVYGPSTPMSNGDREKVVRVKDAAMLEEIRATVRNAYIDAQLERGARA